MSFFFAYASLLLPLATKIFVLMLGGVIWYLWHLVFPSFSNKINYTRENQLCVSCENLNWEKTCGLTRASQVPTTASHWQSAAPFRETQVDTRTLHCGHKWTLGHCIVDTLGHLDTGSRTTALPAILLPLQQSLTHLHIGYNWRRVHFIYGCLL